VIQIASAVGELKDPWSITTLGSWGLIVNGISGLYCNYSRHDLLCLSAQRPGWECRMIQPRASNRERFVHRLSSPSATNLCGLDGPALSDAGGRLAMFQGTHLLWALPTSPDLSVAEDVAAGEGMVASEVSQAATASAAKLRSDDAPFHCPMCKGQLLSRDSTNVIPTVRRLAGKTFYCPSCEMFVEPVEESAASHMRINSVTGQVRSRYGRG